MSNPGAALGTGTTTKTTPSSTPVSQSSQSANVPVTASGTTVSSTATSTTSGSSTVLPVTSSPSSVLPATSSPSPVLPATSSPSPVLPATSSPSPVLSATSSPSPVPSPVTTQQISGGEAAGIAIGTFIAGIIFTLAAVWLLTRLRSKKKQSLTSNGHPGDSDNYHDENVTPLKEMRSTVRPLSTAIDSKIDKLLLEPVSSSDIKTEMLSIGTEVLNNVDNNYHLKLVDNPPASFGDALAKSQYDNFKNGISARRLGILLRDVKTRRPAIQHVINWFIFSHIALTSEIETSLLPSYITLFLRQMPPPEQTNGSREAFDLAFTKWRLLSAYLLQTIRSNRNPLLPDPKTTRAAINFNAGLLRDILGPFVAPGAEPRQVENMAGLLSEGARLGLLLFQQPASWVVDWEVSAGGNGDVGQKSNAKQALVVFPGLVRTVDGEGRRYKAAQSLLGPEVLFL